VDGGILAQRAFYARTGMRIPDLSRPRQDREFRGARAAGVLVWRLADEVERVVLNALAVIHAALPPICAFGDFVSHRLRSRNGCEATAGLSSRSTLYSSKRYA